MHWTGHNITAQNWTQPLSFLLQTYTEIDRPTSSFSHFYTLFPILLTCFLVQYTTNWPLSHCCPSLQTKPYLYTPENCQAKGVSPTNGLLYWIWEYNPPEESQVSLETVGRVWVMYCYLTDNNQRNSEYPSVYRPGLQTYHSCNVPTVFKGPVPGPGPKRLFYYSFVRERAPVSEEPDPPLLSDSKDSIYMSWSILV
jgi:hypothetical protein